LTTPSAPATRWRAEIDGFLVSSRRIGQRVYVVSRFVPYLAGFSYGYPPAATANQQILASTPLASMLPPVRINGGAASPLLGATEIYAPPQGSQPAMADMLVVTAIDLAAPRIAQSLGVIGSSEALYASPTNLFLATSRYQARTINGSLIPTQAYAFLTDIHQ